MLVLTRKAGEKIVIADGITIAVSQIGKNRVRLSIEAPDDVRGVRSEVPHPAPPKVPIPEVRPSTREAVAAT